MKLITLNIEGTRHYDTVLELLRHQSADVLCLQEVPEEFVPEIEELGYQTSFALRCVKSQEGPEYQDGIVVATKVEHSAKTHYYYKYSDKPDDIFIEKIGRRSNHQPLLDVRVIVDGSEFNIVNTHFTWSVDGLINDAQQEDLASLLSYTQNLPPHLLCGDFNLPRIYNSLYKDIIHSYQDNIPDHVQSSLDPELHRIRNNPQDAHHVNDFMVDYVFSQPPYQVSDVELQYGVSDHAAVIAEVSK